MASILPNVLGKSGLGSSSLDNFLISAFWFGRRSSPHTQSIAEIYQSQNTSTSAPLRLQSEAQDRKMEMSSGA